MDQSLGWTGFAPIILTTTTKSTPIADIMDVLSSDASKGQVLDKFMEGKGKDCELEERDRDLLESLMHKTVYKNKMTDEVVVELEVADGALGKSEASEYFANVECRIDTM